MAPASVSGAAGTAPSWLDRLFGWLRGLDVRRDTHDKWLAGVCSGVARRLGVDPIVIRAVLIVLILLGGVGITLYLIAWAFIPSDREDILAERAVRHGEVGPILLLAVVALSLLGGSRVVDGDGFGLWWLFWVAVPIGVVVWLVTRDRGAPATALPPHAGGPPAAYGSTYAGSSPTAATTPSSAGSPVPYAASPAAAPPAPYAAGSAPGDPRAPGRPGRGYAPPSPPRTPGPVPPPRPRRRSAGFLGAVVAGGLALAAYGVSLWAHREWAWAGDEHVVALATALAVLGLAVLGMGLAGLRSGLTGFMALVLALLTWTAAVVPGLTVGGGLGDRVWRPTGASAVESYRLGAGSANLDLGGYPTDPASPGTVRADVGLGELRILVPDDLTVEIRSDVGAGDIREAGGWGVDQNRRWSQDGPGGRRLSTVEVIGAGEPDLVVDASVGMGQIIIGKE